jgi:peptide/nickel transport system permease protein
MLPRVALAEPGFSFWLLEEGLPAPSLSHWFLGKKPSARYSVVDSARFDAAGNASYLLPTGERKEVAEGEVLSRQTFWLGSDRFGRDLLSRLIVGSRVSISVGLVAVLISLLVGVPLGAIAGFYGGWIDRIVTWFIQVVWTLPTLLMVIAVTLALGKGFWQVFVAIGLTMWVEVARVVRGEVMSQSKRLE